VEFWAVTPEANKMPKNDESFILKTLPGEIEEQKETIQKTLDQRRLNYFILILTQDHHYLE